jgi:hypothetical protein
VLAPGLEFGDHAPLGLDHQPQALGLLLARPRPCPVRLFRPAACHILKK